MSRNAKLLALLSCIAFGMLGLSFAFVPLYERFCQLIGIPIASVQVGEAGKAKPLGPVGEREIKIRFIGNSNIGVPVVLKPAVPSLRVKINEQALTAYTAINPDDTPMDGVAVHTLIAHGSDGEEGDVSAYVDLQQCFCFEQQHYPAGQTVSLPLSFHITSDLPEEIHSITFAYTLYADNE